jgi:hypothetical protein
MEGFIMRTVLFFTSLLTSVSCATSALCQPSPGLQHRYDEEQLAWCFKQHPPHPHAPALYRPREARRRQAWFPQYVVEKLTDEVTDSLKAYLRDDCFEHALQLYFPGSRSDRLVDWVVYIDSTGGVHQAVTRGWRTRREFRAEKYVWVLVFSDSSLGEDRKEGRLQFARRSISYQPPPTLTAIVQAVAGKFFSGDRPAPTPVPRDTSKTIVLHQVAEHPDRGQLWVALDRYDLVEDTQVELSLHPDSATRLPGRLRSVYTNIGNAPRATWEFGVAAGLSFGERTEVLKDDGTAVVGTRPGLQPNLYLTGYVNLVRPRTQHRHSLGPVVGVNLARGGLFDELIAGVALGHVVEDVGLVVGGSWNNVKHLEHDDAGAVVYRERRKLVPIVAFDLRL